jgi:lipoprotein-releasing system permease protein
MPFELFVALRYLRAKRRQTLVSVISAISVIGIAAGVMALVIALALSTGFREEIQDKIVGATSHANLLRVDNAPIADYETLLRRLERTPRVVGSAPAIFSQVFVMGSYRSQGAMLKGIDPARERSVSDFFSHIVAGDPEALERPSPVGADPDAPPPPGSLIVGKELAHNLGVHPGDALRIAMPQGTLTPLGLSVRVRTFRVAAVFESGLWDYDSNWAYTGMAAERRFFGLPPGSASVLQFRTDDLEGVETTADALRAAAGAGFTTTTWIDLNRPLFSALKLEKLALFVTISLIVFVASLNIVTTLIMMVMDKARDIAILSAMGATERTIMFVFMLQGLLIGIVGTVIGTVIGVSACHVLDKYRLIRLAAEVYSISYVPFHTKPWDVLLVTSTALAISFVATLYPARRAARLDPVEVLRHE